MSQEELLARWPKDPDGEPEKAALLKNESDFPGYRDICCSMLDSFGIPYFTKRPGAGELLYIRGGFSIEGIDIYVPASRLEEALDLLNATAEFAEEENKEETL